jgi:hypothetical protein
MRVTKELIVELVFELDAPTFGENELELDVSDQHAHHRGDEQSSGRRRLRQQLFPARPRHVDSSLGECWALAPRRVRATPLASAASATAVATAGATRWSKTLGIT